MNLVTAMSQYSTRMHVHISFYLIVNIFVFKDFLDVEDFSV